MTDTAAIFRGAPLMGGAREPALSRREVRAAIFAEAGLYLVGALLCATALLVPHVRAPEAVAAVGVNAVIVAAVLVLAARRDRAGLMLAFVGDLWGVVLVAILCAAAGGASSPFALIYLFAIGHAAGFQPRGRYIVVLIAAIVAFLLPLTYESVPEAFGAAACVGIVLAVLTTLVIHLALNSVREHRRRLKFLIDATASFDTSLDPAEALRDLKSRLALGTAIKGLIANQDKQVHAKFQTPFMSPPLWQRLSVSLNNESANVAPLAAGRFIAGSQGESLRCAMRPDADAYRNQCRTGYFSGHIGRIASFYLGFAKSDENSVGVAR